MKNFRKWDCKRIEDDCCVMSEEAKSFFRSFKAFLKRNLPGCTLDGFKANHYDTSGFITFPSGKIIYVSYSLNRMANGYCSANFSDTSYMNGVLYRTAQSTKDYRGGNNHFTSIYRLIECIKEMEKTMQMQAVA